MSNFEIVVAIATFVICFVSGVLCGITAYLVHDTNKMIEKIQTNMIMEYYKECSYDCMDFQIVNRASC